MCRTGAGTGEFRHDRAYAARKPEDALCGAFFRQGPHRLIGDDLLASATADADRAMQALWTLMAINGAIVLVAIVLAAA